MVGCFIILLYKGEKMIVDDIGIEYTLKKDNDLNMVSGVGKINIFLNDDFESIGSIRFNFYNVYMFNSLTDLLVSASAISGDEGYMVSSLSEEDIEEDGKLITLDRIVMKEEYTSPELEKTILKEFLDYCGYMMFDYVSVIASQPLNLGVEKKKLIEFPQLWLYKELNFKVIGGTERRAPVMLKNLHLIN